MDLVPMDDELRRIVDSIPVGRVASYGEVGQAMSTPVSGFLVGRMLRRAKSEMAWWRVVAKTGNLPVAKMDPMLASEQRLKLQEEGVQFLDDQVHPEAFVEL